MRRCVHVLAATLVLAPALFVTAPASANERIGRAEVIENRVFSNLDGRNERVSVEDPVHRNETIRTEAASLARLRLVDRSDVRIGPQASLKLDALVFSGSNRSAMQLLRGGMRFVSGNGPSGSYRIQTPVATIGLRGTIVEVVIRGGRTFVTLHEGAAQVCARGGRCVELTSACTFAAVGGGSVTAPAPVSAQTPRWASICSGGLCAGSSCSPGAASPRSGLGFDPAGSGTGGGGPGGNTGGGNTGGGNTGGQGGSGTSGGKP